MKTNLLYSIAATLAIAGIVAFSGCSGGGGSDGTTIGVSSSTGTFVDSEVQGLDYTGPTYTGVTDEDGYYLFVSGETVVFSLGDIVIGSLLGSETPVSPLDFFDGATIDDPRVVNLVILLQALDTDGDPTNGIDINATAVESLEAAVDTETYNPATENVAVLIALLETVAPVDVPTQEEAIEHFTESLLGEQPIDSNITGTTFASCTNDTVVSAVNLAELNASAPVNRRATSLLGSDQFDNSDKSTSHKALVRLGFEIDGMSRDGNLTGTKVRPLVLNYLEQIVGDYELGDGSADIGDPEHVDGVYVAVSLDDGLTWKQTLVSDTTDKSSMDVNWALAKDSNIIAYPGNALKPEFAVVGNKILIGWGDKYCPSANPLDLEKVDSDVPDENASYPLDYFAVNGKQGSIDYADAQDGSREIMIAPNGKEVYEVPFSCVWTARGIIDDSADGNATITWHMPKQLTSGVRDVNHIWISGSSAGFAMAWQEDTEGLRSGKGAGPGEGWSGATTSHGSDIWYSSIKMEDFDAGTVTNDENVDSTKLVSTNNFHYPVRITDNQTCSEGDTKVYCQSMCTKYGSVESTTGNNAESTITRCKTYDDDMLVDGIEQVVLDGDTGASRVALKMLRTDDEEDVVILAYEETKGLSENESGTGDQDQGDSDTDIAVEGKSVYFESFNFNAIDDFNASDPLAFLNTGMPLVSAGNIINVKSPEAIIEKDENNVPTVTGTTGEMIFQNARRVVIGNQIDSCDVTQGVNTFALMFKESYDTQGASSDMYVRVNNGFTYDSFVPLNDATAGDLNITNVSAQAPQVVENATDYIVDWSAANLDDANYEDSNDNTYSPRIVLRGDVIYVGYEYTPDATKTGNDRMPNNFHTNFYMNGAWQGPVNVTQVTKASVNTVDARMVPTPKGVYNGTTHTLESDKANPNVFFLTWGEIDFLEPDLQDGKVETDLWYRRALYDEANGWVWDTNSTKLAARDGGYIQEKEVGSFATPDGTKFYSTWIQETELEHADRESVTDNLAGLDTWVGVVDYNISNVTP